MKRVLFITLVLLALMTFGCTSRSRTTGLCPYSNPVSMVASYTSKPIVIDGNLDEAIWQDAPAYKMTLPADKCRAGRVLEENGTVRFSWDEQYFYVAVDFNDSDIVADGKTDQLLHYDMGDVAELFLKPDNCTWYWELYATPAGNKTSIWFPGRGRMFIPSDLDYNCGLKVAARCNGTLNNWRDKDNGWTAEMAMPVKDLTAKSEKFGPGSKWHILIGRYNYSRYLNSIGPELSSTPQLSAANYSLLEEYANVIFKN